MITDARLREIATDADNFYRDEIKSMASELLSLRSDAHTSGEVKALEWKGKNPIRDNGDLRAHSVVGMYEIGTVAGSVMVMLRCVKRGDADDISVGSFDTFEAAKAAAQADFETRIRSALSLGHPIQGEAKPTGYAYELATRVLGAVTGIEGYASFEERISFEKPTVPDGAIRNLRPLFASPQPPTPAGVREITEEIEVLLDNCHVIEDIDIAAQHEAAMVLVKKLAALAAATGGAVRDVVAPLRVGLISDEAP